MRRRLLTIAIFLLAGAAVNVAVAWGLAFWLPRPPSVPFGNYREGFTRQGDGFSDWMVDVSVAAGVVRIYSHWLNGSPKFIGKEPEYPAADVLPAWGLFARPSGTYPPDVYVLRIVDARGWPMVSMWSGIEFSAIPRPAAIIGNAVTVTNAYLPASQKARPYPDDVANLRVIPLAPIWPGFAANTFFYAAIIWLLIPGPFALHRLIRRRRGLCPACGYDLRHGEHEACPECGVTA